MILAESSRGIKSGDAYSKYFSTEELEAEFARSIAGRTTVGKDRITAKRMAENLDEEIETIRRKVDNGNSRFTDYRQQLILKGLGKQPREICIPTARDMLVLVALKCVLKDVIGHSCATPKPQQVIADLHRTIIDDRFDYFIKIDIAEFYHSINHQKLEHALAYRLNVRKPQVLRLIHAAITTPSSSIGVPRQSRRISGLPEGLPISNLLANAYLSKIDADCRKNSPMGYFRYVDDIVILCDASYARTAKKFIVARVKKLGLTVNPEKMPEGTIGLKRLEYLGYVFDGGDVCIRRSSVVRMEQRLELLIKRYARATQAN